MVMLGGRLLIVCVLGQAPVAADVPATAPASFSGSAPEALVARLGANRYAEREAAALALEQLGKPALPALRAAGSSRDPEVRRRAGRIAIKIEQALLVEPSRVRLDFQDAPIEDVARSLARQTGFQIELGPPTFLNRKPRRVTLHEPGEFPFWQAIDRICAVARLHYNPGLLPVGDVFNGATPSIALADGPSRLATPISDHGPFRVILMGLDYQRHVYYAARGPTVTRPLPPRPIVGGRLPGRIVNPVVGVPLPPEPVVTVQFAADLMVAAEPRLSMRENGAIQVIEAIDDRGNSLAVSKNDDGLSGRPIERSVGNPGFARAERGARFHVRAALRRPDAPGRRVKVLRGTVPIVVSSRRPNPLVVPLDRGAGKRFEGGDVVITLHEVRAAGASRQVFIELSIQPGGARPVGDAAADLDALHEARFTESQKLQLEILDSKGRAVRWFVSSVDAERSRLTLTLMNAPADTLKELRYHSLTRAAVNLPFEFRDFLMP